MDDKANYDYHNNVNVKYYLANLYIIGKIELLKILVNVSLY